MLSTDDHERGCSHRGAGVTDLINFHRPSRTSIHRAWADAPDRARQVKFREMTKGL